MAKSGKNSRPGNRPAPPRTAPPVSSTPARKPTSAAPSPAKTTSATTSATIKPRPANSRTTPPPPDNSGNLMLVLVGGVALVILAGLIWFFTNTGSSATPAAVATPAAGDIAVEADPAAVVQQFANQGQQHLAAGQTLLSLLPGGYNSNPPTSGTHQPIWSNNGVFNPAPADELLVHNMEHGSVIILYNCPESCVSTVNLLSNYARRYTPTAFTGVLLVPRNNLPDGARIALTAWQNRMLLKTFDRDKIERFIATYIGKGPEQDPNFKP